MNFGKLMFLYSMLILRLWHGCVWYALWCDLMCSNVSMILFFTVIPSFILLPNGLNMSFRFISSIYSIIFVHFDSKILPVHEYSIFFKYRDLKDLRCIVFVERVITAIVVQSLLSELLPKHNNWKAKFIAGNNRGLLYQTRKNQNEIVEEFRRGMVCWFFPHKIKIIFFSFEIPSVMIKKYIL